MSCTLCRLPFTPHVMSTNPRPAPTGVLTNQQNKYLQKAVGVWVRNFGVVSRWVYLDQNIFGTDFDAMYDDPDVTPIIMNQTWENPKDWEPAHTLMFLHLVCAAQLRAALGASGDSVSELADLLEINSMFGLCKAAPRSGELPLPWEYLNEKIDVDDFWTAGDELGVHTFDWEGFKAAGHGWLLSVPNVFPAFKPLTQERIASVGESVPQPGSFTWLPTEILRLVLVELTVRSFVKLGATCRLLRKEWLTTLQDEARRRVLRLNWATPSSDEAATMKTAGMEPVTASAPAYSAAGLSTGEPARRGMDWLLYLSHMHRTTAMRARQRICERADFIRFARDAARRMEPWAPVAGPDGALHKSNARMQLEMRARFLRSLDLSRKGGMENVQQMMMRAQNAQQTQGDEPSSIEQALSMGTAQMMDQMIKDAIHSGEVQSKAEWQAKITAM